MPVQIASNPTVKESIHWRVEKLTPLFRGEDFFLEFHRMTTSTDLNNSKDESEQSFKNYFDNDDMYKPIDAFGPANGDNRGVVSYQVKDRKYVPIEESKKIFNLNQQAYIIIEMGVGLKFRYFIIITQRGRPRFVKVLMSSTATEDKEEGESKSKGISYLISEYKNATGSKLLNDNVLKIAVRNHLGKLVIVFNDNNDQPWVVTDIPVAGQESKSAASGGAAANSEASNDPGDAANNQSDSNSIPQEGTPENPHGYALDKDGNLVPVKSSSASDTAEPDCPPDEPTNTPDPGPLFVVPGAAIAIWGGNMSIGFTFSPIQYIDKALLNLPFPSKNIYKESEEISALKDDLADAQNEDVNDSQLADFEGDDGGKRALSDESSAQQQEDISKEIALLQYDANPFVLPGDVDVLLSIRDMGLDPDSTPRDPGRSGGQGGVRSNGKKPFYICDAQRVEEIRETWTSDAPPFFMDTGEFIKDKQEKRESFIGIKKKELKPEGNKKVFFLNVTFTCGSHVFPSGYELLNCKTPVLNTIRLVGLPVIDDAWGIDEIDASDLVLQYSDTWSSQDYHKMEHTGNISFLVNRDLGGIAKDIEALRNKAFYIQVFASYDGCNYSQFEQGKNEDEGGIVGKTPGSRVAPTEMYKLMTGICYGGTITEKPGERIMMCKVQDYSKILKDYLIFNSPFFDGVRDINAIYELTKMSNFKESEVGDPAFLIKKHVDQTENSDIWGEGTVQSADGRKIPKSRVYALPAAYARLQGNAEFRFNDGDNVMQALEKIANRSGKVIFFDVDGQLHYEAFPIADVIYGNGNISDVDSESVTTWLFTAKPGENGQLVFKEVTREIAVEDVYNNIHIVSSTPHQEMIFADRINEKGLIDPTSEGFLGYRKTFLQKDPIFGHEKPVTLYADHLTKFFRPPVVFKFSTYGLPMRCFDIADVDGQKLIIVNISHSIVGKENQWWTTIEGEWLSGETGQLKS